MKRLVDRKSLAGLLAAATLALLGSSVQAASTPVISSMRLSPPRFAAEKSGPSARASARRAVGTRVSYRLNRAAAVHFTIRRRESGRRVTRGGVTTCVPLTRANRNRKRCVRAETLSGGFSKAGAPGLNSFRFTGRLRGARLRVGGYDLVATPVAGGTTGPPVSATFRIAR